MQLICTPGSPRLAECSRRLVRAHQTSTCPTPCGARACEAQTLWLRGAVR
jgi:hypothetical protein